MVTVYTKPSCGACTATKVWLRRHGLEFTEFDVEADHAARAAVTVYGYSSLPVVVGDDGRHWSGFQERRLKGLLEG
jgi:glutaredoxin-like protein NrdH